MGSESVARSQLRRLGSEPRSAVDCRFAAEMDT
jgi:hypothetical protein